MKSTTLLLGAIALVVASQVSMRANGESPQQVTRQSAKRISAQEHLAKALEVAGPGADAAKLKEALGYIELAIQADSSFGDPYYYGALVCTQLGDANKASSYRQRAEFLGSEAMKEGLDLAGNAGSARIAEAPMKVSAAIGKRLALVVGIGAFKDSSINQLQFTAKDARSMADALSSVCHFDSVKSLIDQEATTYAIKTEVDRLAKMAGPDDLVVVYFSSHGSPESADTAGVNYIVTYDTEVNNLYATSYKMDELLRDLTDRIKSERVVAFLDTCFSGGTFKKAPAGWAVSSRTLTVEGAPQAAAVESRLKSGSRVITVEPAAPAVDRVPQGIGRVVISSSSANEKSWEDERLQHGYFTYYLLQALNLKTPISVEEVFDHLRLRVPEAVARDKNQQQHPTIARNRTKIEVYLRDERPGAVPRKQDAERTAHTGGSR